MTADTRTASATGFIGGTLANALADDGWHVRALVRDSGRESAPHLAEPLGLVTKLQRRQPEQAERGWKAQP